MGMYTGVRARVKIKPLERHAIQRLHDDGSWEDVLSFNVGEWLKYERCNFIPFGVLSYMPSDFEEPFESADGGSTFDGVWWTFSCSLKNYKNEIDFFMKNVLCHLVEDVDYCESLYEEWPYLNEINHPHYYGREWWGQCVTDWSDFLLGKTQDSP